MRLIDGDRLLITWRKMTIGRKQFDSVIINAPEIEAVPIVRGHWVKVDSRSTKFTCSQCSHQEKITP